MEALGIRLNNPLNIRFSPMNNWQGQVGSEKGFCKFVDFEHGFRAALVLLCNYQRKGYDTIRKIVTHWAPPSENNTEAYITHCCSHVFVPDDVRRHRRIDADERITTFGCICSLAAAMCEMEIGIHPRELVRKPLNLRLQEAFDWAVLEYKYPVLKS